MLISEIEALFDSEESSEGCVSQTENGTAPDPTNPSQNQAMEDVWTEILRNNSELELQTDSAPSDQPSTSNGVGHIDIQNSERALQELGRAIFPVLVEQPSSSIEVGHVQNYNGLCPAPLDNFGADGSMARKRRGVVQPWERFKLRQARMIKNRESAARSRSRKAAYTNELEDKKSQLLLEIEELRTKIGLYEKYCKLVPDWNKDSVQGESEKLFKKLKRSNSCPL